MSDYASIADDVLAALRDLSSEEYTAKMQHYFTTEQVLLGVNSPGIRKVVKEVKAAHRDWEPGDWIGLAKALVKPGIFECQVAGFELLAMQKKNLDAMTDSDARALMVNMDNWASVDHFSVAIHGVLWREGTVSDERIFGLLHSKVVWERRIAVVSTVSLNLRSRGGTGDTDRTLRVCRQVVDERHPMIWKALSWALRTLIFWDREAVEDFLEEYGDRMSRQAVREVRHKLDHGTKN